MVRRGRPDRTRDDQPQRVITATLERTPRDATHWRTRTLAKELDLSATRSSSTKCATSWASFWRRRVAGSACPVGFERRSFCAPPIRGRSSPLRPVGCPGPMTRRDDGWS